MLLLQKCVSGQNVHFAVYDSFVHLEQRIQRDTARVLVVNFWATWCKPCVEELPYFETLRERYASDGLNVLLISLDFKSQKDKRLRPFLMEHPMGAEVALLADQAADLWMPQVSEDWDGAIPATVVIGPDKQMLGFHSEKFEDFRELENFIKPFLDR
jgi:thiol-disulfide isomerase/thioredoxin